MSSVKTKVEIILNHLRYIGILLVINRTYMKKTKKTIALKMFFFCFFVVFFVLIINNARLKSFSMQLLSVFVNYQCLIIHLII